MEQGSTWTTRSTRSEEPMSTCSTISFLSLQPRWFSTGLSGWPVAASLGRAIRGSRAGSFFGKTAVRTTFAIAPGAFAALASAQSSGFPISTDRPSFSDGTLIVPMGRWQIESGYTYNRVAGSQFETFGELLFRVPMSQRLELRLSNVSIGRTSSTSGWVDPSLGFKLKLLEASDKRPDLALIVQSSVPSGERSFRVGRWQPTVKLAWYKQSDAATGFGGNLIASDLGPNGARFTQYAASLYVSKTLNPLLGAFAEVYGLGPLSYGGPNGGFFDTGVTYLLNDRTQLDLRYGTGFNQSRDGWFVGAGVSFRF